VEEVVGAAEQTGAEGAGEEEVGAGAMRPSDRARAAGRVGRSRRATSSTSS